MVGAKFVCERARTKHDQWASNELIEAEALCLQVFESILLSGFHRFIGMDMQLTAKGDGLTSKIYELH